MKKLNLTLKIALLFVAFLTYNFIPKTKFNLIIDSKENNLNVTNSSYTNKVLIMYQSGITDYEKSQTRNCIANNVGHILQVSPCPNNNNVEIITFSSIKIEDPGSTGLGKKEDDDNDDDELDQGYFLISSSTITLHELHIKIGRCSNILGHSINISDCSAPLPIDSFDVGQ